MKQPTISRTTANNQKPEASARTGVTAVGFGELLGIT